ncbi:unnamed protein product [Lupinus luteus]|uniref:Uncharacterized protein n=1 Tax=Lupinus luteus TaxID=3873 RepID=A0AAV1XQN3_LUPLU
MRITKEFMDVMMLLSTWAMSMKGEELIKSPSSTQGGCDFLALFSFGGSNSDTGSMAAAFYPETSSYGQTFFKEPVGRA